MKPELPPGARHGLIADAGLHWNGLTVLVLSPTPTLPLDAGNRRRIDRITRALHRMGSRILFAHYPAEADWREEPPLNAVAGMAAQWDEYYTIPVTVPLHRAAAGLDHEIDEWWDPAIGDMLRWLFKTHAIDVVIVNYSWLSKAFEFCPSGVLKVLDTHDRFSGRREILEQHGIPAEFFHTTEQQERIALSRADVVWSIKPQEATFFRSLGARHVVNMPHVEQLELAPALPRPDGIVRFGLFGAANNINRVNTEAFLSEIISYVEQTLLPCEVVIAGGLCDLLAPPTLPWIRFLGRVDSPGDFYREVDVVLAPVAFSTGLKIKVGEALCMGKAVVALDHAFEGFPARHPFHTLTSLPEMIGAIRRIVDEPELIGELERLSVMTTLEMQAEVARGFADTIGENPEVRLDVCIVAGAADIFVGSLVLDHILEAARYAGHLAPIHIYLAGHAETPADPAALALLRTAGTIIVAPALLCGAVGEALRPRGGRQTTRSATLAELFRQPALAFWFASDPGPWPLPASRISARAYIALDPLILSGSEATAQEVTARARETFRDVVMLSRSDQDSDAGPSHKEHRVPLLWRGERSSALAQLAGAPRRSVTILADEPGDALAALVVAVTRRLSNYPIEIVVPRNRWVRAEFPGAEPAKIRLLPADRCFGPAAAEPLLVIDVSIDPAFEALREVFDRAEIPRATLFDPGGMPAHGSWRGGPAAAASSGQETEDGSGRASGVYRSVALLSRLLRDPTAAAAAARGSYAQDSGWASIWDEIGALLTAAPAAVEAYVSTVVQFDQRVGIEMPALQEAA